MTTGNVRSDARYSVLQSNTFVPLQGTGLESVPVPPGVSLVTDDGYARTLDGGPGIDVQLVDNNTIVVTNDGVLTVTPTTSPGTAMVIVSSPANPILKSIVPEGEMTVDLANGVITLGLEAADAGTVTSVAPAGGGGTAICLAPTTPTPSVLSLAAGTNTAPEYNEEAGTVQINLSGVVQTLTNAGNGEVDLVTVTTPGTAAVSSIAAGAGITVVPSTGFLTINSSATAPNDIYVTTTTAENAQYLLAFPTIPVTVPVAAPAYAPAFLSATGRRLSTDGST